MCLAYPKKYALLSCMQLIVIRHGETNSNLKGVIQGQRIDDSLTEAGITKVQAAISSLAKENIRALYSSHLLRARQTAEIFSTALNLPLLVRPELAERDFGSLSGMTWETAVTEAGDEELWEKDRNHTFDYRPFGGESITEVRARIQGFLKDSIASHNDQTIVCVTHGGIIRLLYNELTKEKPLHVSNVSLHTFNVSAADIPQ